MSICTSVQFTFNIRLKVFILCHHLDFITTDNNRFDNLPICPKIENNFFGFLRVQCQEIIFTSITKPHNTSPMSSLIFLTYQACISEVSSAFFFYQRAHGVFISEVTSIKSKKQTNKHPTNRNTGDKTHPRAAPVSM